MPLGKGVRYRVTDSGVRLAFKGGKVIEAKNLESGATHTPAEFKADEKKKKKRKPDWRDYLHQGMSAGGKKG